MTVCKAESCGDIAHIYYFCLTIREAEDAETLLCLQIYTCILFLYVPIFFRQCLISAEAGHYLFDVTMVWQIQALHCMSGDMPGSALPL